MRNSLKRGLTLGKFAPLHQGHQWLLNTALAEMDEVVVIIYDCPERTDIPLPIRANWLRGLYPTVEVIEAWDGPCEVGDTPAIKKSHEDVTAQYFGAVCRSIMTLRPFKLVVDRFTPKY